MSEQAGRYQRSAAGMVGAMLVLVAVVFGFVVLRDLNRNDPQNPVKPVDYQETLKLARGQAEFPLLAPASLPKGWRATSVRFVPQPTRWHLGVLTNKDEYVGLEQSQTSVGDMVETYVDQAAVRGGTVQIVGESWRTWTDAGGDTALTRVQKGVTTLVVGTPGRDVLVDYVKSLR
ncbi:MAG TPA: DUF4245 domain-containing protein [Nocardioidaceae bacterium]|nr:DUF4245 domain-containing protein [Nocardioidaceae bacterium]